MAHPAPGEAAEKSPGDPLRFNFMFSCPFRAQMPCFPPELLNWLYISDLNNLNGVGQPSLVGRRPENHQIPCKRKVTPRRDKYPAALFTLIHRFEGQDPGCLAPEAALPQLAGAVLTLGG